MSYSMTEASSCPETSSRPPGSTQTDVTGEPKCKFAFYSAKDLSSADVFFENDVIANRQGAVQELRDPYSKSGIWVHVCAEGAFAAMECMRTVGLTPT